MSRGARPASSSARVALLVLVGACHPAGPAPEDTGTTDTATVPTDSTPTAVDPCAGGGFDGVARAWGLPEEGAEGSWTAPGQGEADCAAGHPGWFTADLDGDARLDLVHTSVCGVDEVGTSRWEVVLGDSLGFGGTPVAWALPAGFGAGAFVSPAGAGRDCDAGRPTWTHDRDLTGDGRPDLVVTADCADASVGTDHWRVFANTGLGYSTTGTTWRLPSGFGERAFEAPRDGVDCATQAPAWRIADLDGDARPDLIATATCADADVGTDHWSVWFSSGSGFAPNAAVWPLPDLGPGALVGPADAPVCEGDARPSWLLADMDGDLRMDLTLTGSCADSELGQDAWRVHRGDGAGFDASGGRWPLPAGYAAGSFYAPRSAQDCDAGLPAWAFRDLDADGAPDVLLTASCADATVGSTRWLLHASRGARLDGTAIPWTLPTGFPVGSFAAEQGASTCGADDHPAWFLVDPDGTGVVDVMLTEDCDEPAIGTSRWSRYLGSCG